MDQPTSALEIVETFVSLSDCPELEQVTLNQAHIEIPDQYLASEKAHRLLDWQPQHTLREGLEKTFGWYRLFLASE